jgi:hypothetical protein
MKKIDDVQTSHGIFLPYLEIISPNSKASSNNIANLPNTMPIMHKLIIHIKIKLVIIVRKVFILH